MIKIIRKVLAVSLLLSISAASFSDDTDIIAAEIPTDTNILFVMDMSGSMRWSVDSDTVPSNPADSRKNILHSALRTVLNDPLLTDVNIGIASFSGNTSSGGGDQWAHGISYPISPIDADAGTVLDSNPFFDHKGISYLPAAGGVSSRGYIGDRVPTTWTPVGGTPIVDALYEAALYFRGESVEWGAHSPSSVRSAHPSSYTGTLDVSTSSVTNYVCNTVSCSGAACDALPPSSPNTITPGSKSCNPVPHVITCRNASCVATAEADGAVCTGPTTGRTRCAAGDTSCGNGNNCAESVWKTVAHTCNLGSAAECETANPSWNPGSCSSVTNPGCVTTCPDGIYNEVGACLNPVKTCNPTTSFSCKEDIKRFYCDADKYECTKEVQRCTHEVCGDETTTTSTPGSATYKSPITDECASNGIILLSDGVPTLSNSSGFVRGLVGAAYHNNCDSGSDNGRCGNELTKFLAEEDNSSSIPGEQFVNTHTIGFALTDPNAKAYLEQLAFNGGGNYVNASSPEGLVEALINTIKNVAKARSFSSPTYAPDSSTLMSHGEDVYVPLFDRGVGPVWSGNLKKFKRSGSRLVDADGLAATDSLGAVKDKARDFWSATAVTSALTGGGFANMIDPVKRTNGSVKVYTDNGSNGTAAALTPLNATTPIAKFNVSNEAYKKKLVKFILGERSDGTARHHMGDIIHSKPVHLSYGTKKVLFVGTNEGYLHAIDDATGEEVFAYMPSELLKNIDKQYKNDSLTKHPYGVDGPITLWHDDVNNNKVVDGTEKAYLFFGLRRGGKSYYALNVTNPLSPTLEWRITATGDFVNLGYTWSQPTLAKMTFLPNTTPKPVLVFGGGYIDDNGIDGPVQVDDGSTTTGTEVYIVDASNGAKVWKTSDSSAVPATAAKYAVPATIRVLDINRNGSLDRIYFGDTGGNIWRVDFKSKTPSDAKVMHFAQLGGTPATGRKFFAEPDVAIFKHAGRYLTSVSIGSGERPNPLDASRDDHFFVLFDTNVVGTPTTAPAVIKIGDLSDATGGPVANVLSAGKKGWFIDLVETNGEKVLSSALTYQNMIMFNSFGTNSITVTACEVGNTNESRFYILDLLTGGPVLDLDESGTVTTGASDKSKKAATGVILGEPQVIFNKLKAGNCQKGDCPREVELGHGTAPNTTPTPTKALRRIFWIDEE